MASCRANVTFLVVRVTPLGYDTGHWCRTCVLPSGIRVWLGVQCGPALSMRAHVWCRDCGGRNIEIE